MIPCTKHADHSEPEPDHHLSMTIAPGEDQNCLYLFRSLSLSLCIRMMGQWFCYCTSPCLVTPILQDNWFSAESSQVATVPRISQIFRHYFTIMSCSHQNRASTMSLFCRLHPLSLLWCSWHPWPEPIFQKINISHNSILQRREKCSNCLHTANLSTFLSFAYTVQNLKGKMSSEECQASTQKNSWDIRVTKKPKRRGNMNKHTCTKSQTIPQVENIKASRENFHKEEQEKRAADTSKKNYVSTWCKFEWRIKVYLETHILLCGKLYVPM